MAFLSSYSPVIRTSTVPNPIPSNKLKASRISSFQPLNRVSVQSAVGNIHRQQKWPVKMVSAEVKRSDSVVTLASTVGTSEVNDKRETEDYEKMAKELENASPLQIIDKALEKFGNDIAIAFSGAEDVALIEYARLTGRPFRVFSLDTGRLNLETYQFFDTVEKCYGIHIEYTFPDAIECCRVRKVRPLKKALTGLRAWITGQRKDQSPGTRADIPVVQVDPSFEGVDGGIGSLVKWNPVANIQGRDIWNFLRAMDVPINALHSRGRENVISLSRSGIENLAKLKNRSEPWVVVLYASWCRVCQAMEGSYVELADTLGGSGVKVGKFRADGDQRAFAEKELQLVSFPAILFFPKHSSRPVKYPSEKRDADSLMAFVNAFR
ncbi:hypothetical protein C3L33_09845, partial [Rhododendron williamsianum]